MNRKLRKNTLKLLKLLFKNDFNDLATVGRKIYKSKRDEDVRAQVRKVILAHKTLITDHDGKYFPTMLCMNTYLKDQHYIKEEENGEIRELHKIQYNATLVNEPRFDMLQWRCDNNNIESKTMARNGSQLYIKDNETGYSATIYKNKRVIFHLLEHPQGKVLSDLMDYRYKEIQRCIKSFHEKLTHVKEEGQGFELSHQDEHLAKINHPFGIWLKKNQLKVVVRSVDNTRNDIIFDESGGINHTECENPKMITKVDARIDQGFIDMRDGYSMSENFKKAASLQDEFNKNEVAVKSVLFEVVRELNRFKTDQLDRLEIDTRQKEKITILLDNLTNKFTGVNDRLLRVESKLNMK